MKKEYIAACIIGLYIFSHILDILAGPISFMIKSPLEFIQNGLISLYPFTTVSVIVKAVAIVSSFLFVFSYIKYQYFLKGTVLFFVGLMLELYSIQQFATGNLLLPLPWILGFSLTGAVLLLPTVVFILLGTFQLVVRKTLNRNKENEFEY